MNLYDKQPGVETRWISFENSSIERGQAAFGNKGSKGHAYDSLKSGETKALLDVACSGSIRRIWLTINDRSPEMLRGLRIEMFWDGSSTPAVSAPLGDFFGVGLGRCVAFESALFSDTEGRSFNSFVPMPFRTRARVTLTNDLGRDLEMLFYDIDLLVGENHSPEMMYFHAHWRRESPNELGKEFDILPYVPGAGRFLGSNVGVITNAGYGGSWWGEGEVKVWFGGDSNPTLCGTGTEDYIGTGWGQGMYTHRTQGCHIADGENESWAFYRYHVDDPVFFHDGCRVAIQTIGGSLKPRILEMIEKGMAVIPVSVHPTDGSFIGLFDREPHGDIRSDEFPDVWCNFWRQDDWSATAYFYHESPSGLLPPIAPVEARVAGLKAPSQSA